MMRLPEIFTAVFVFVSILSLLFGVYTFLLKRSAPENRVFFACAVSLTIWSLGLGIALSAPSEEASTIWRRIAALGWGTFFSLILHFILIMAEKNVWLKKWRIYMLIYLPALINLIVFALPTGLNPRPFIMVNTAAGWVNVAANNGWDIYYQLYYLCLISTSLAIVWHWGRKSSDRDIKNQSRIIVSTFAFALLFSTLTDTIANAIIGMRIPQIAPVIIMIPMTAIYLIMRRYGFLHHEPSSAAEVMLTPEMRRRFYCYLSIALVSGAVLNFLLQYMLNEDGILVSSLMFSAMFIIIAAMIQLFSRLDISNRLKDIINSLIVSASIPILTINNIQYAGVTVWAFPFILIIMALVINRRTVLGIVSVVTLMTQIIVWAASPDVAVTIDSNDFVGRIGIYLIGIVLAIYVNRIYVERLKQNAGQIALQELITEISTDFVTVNEYNIGEKILALLSRTGTFFKTDMAGACFFDEAAGELSCNRLWFSDEKMEKQNRLRLLSSAEYPWWVDLVKNHEVVHIADTDKIPKCKEEGSRLLPIMKCRSLLCIPVAGEEVMGFLLFIVAGNPRTWPDEQINLLKVLGNMLADAKLKVEAEKEIKYLAYYDSMTGLPNRKLFKDRLTSAVLSAERTDRRLGVVFLDLDSFKAVNDTLGHERGDEMLRVITSKLKKAVRQSDTVARFGGDEFLLLINNLVRENDIVKVMESIMEIFSRPFILKGREFYITASAGIAMYPADGEDADKLIKNADIAMYSAKESGKNQYAMCSHDMKAAVDISMSLTTSLYRALGKSELTLHYQPQVCLQTRKIIGLEALLRWNSAEHGQVSPDRFIPLAEQTGLINPIGEWVLRQSCLQNKKWQDMGLPRLRMAVNLSVIQLQNPRLKDIVRTILEDTGLEPSYLELEITESTATREAGRISGILEQLRGLGVTISIDDFGTEYSSLSRLKMLPLDRIKLDMQFVRGIEEGEKDKAITKVIISLAKTLGIKVIAEGVETRKQSDFLQERMCDEVQGFYFFRPMPAEQIEQILKNGIAVDILDR